MDCFSAYLLAFLLAAADGDNQTPIFLSRKLFKDLVVRGKPGEVMNKLEAD